MSVQESGARKRIDYEDWWGQFDPCVPPPPMEVPLRVIDNPNYARNRKLREARLRKEARMSKTLFAAAAVLLLVCMTLTVSVSQRCAALSKESYEVIAQSNEYIRRRMEMGNLINNATTSETIRNAAKRLGMVEVTANQIRQLPITLSGAQK